MGLGPSGNELTGSRVKKGSGSGGLMEFKRLRV